MLTGTLPDFRSNRCQVRSDIFRARKSQLNLILSTCVIQVGLRSKRFLIYGSNHLLIYSRCNKLLVSCSRFDGGFHVCLLRYTDQLSGGSYRIVAADIAYGDFFILILVGNLLQFLLHSLKIQFAVTEIKSFGSENDFLRVFRSILLRK